MARIVDSDAVLADFEAFLLEDGRSSHGRDFLLRRLAELRARHRIDESADRAVLRRFSDHLTTVFFNETPVTDDPLDDDDPRTSQSMDAGAATAMTRGGHDGSQHSDRRRRTGAERREAARAATA